MHQGPVVNPTFDDDDNAVTEIYTGGSRVGPVPADPRAFVPRPSAGSPASPAPGSLGSPGSLGPFMTTPPPPASTIAPTTYPSSSPPPVVRVEPDIESTRKKKALVVLASALAAVIVGSLAIAFISAPKPTTGAGAESATVASPSPNANLSSPQPSAPLVATSETILAAKAVTEPALAAARAAVVSPKVDPARARDEATRGGASPESGRVVSVTDLPAMPPAVRAVPHRKLAPANASSTSGAMTGAPALPANPYIFGSQLGGASDDKSGSAP